VGFNEVMLPLAEDDRLKELAAVGQLRFRDLLAATPACVAGLDMVPLPSTTETRVLKWVMRDLDAASKLKRKPLGMRVLLVGAAPGEEVELGMFGKTPGARPRPARLEPAFELLPQRGHPLREPSDRLLGALPRGDLQPQVEACAPPLVPPR